MYWFNTTKRLCIIQNAYCYNVSGGNVEMDVTKSLERGSFVRVLWLGTIDMSNVASVDFVHNFTDMFAL